MADKILPALLPGQQRLIRGPQKGTYVNKAKHTGTLGQRVIQPIGASVTPPPPDPAPHVPVAAEFDALDGKLRALRKACEHHFHDDVTIAPRFDSAIEELGRIRVACAEGTQTPQLNAPVPAEGAIGGAFATVIAELGTLKTHCVGHHHEVLDLPDRFDDLASALDSLRLDCIEVVGPTDPPPHHEDDFGDRVPAGWVHIRTDAHWRDLGGNHPIRRHLHFDQAYPPPNQPQSGIVNIPSRFEAFFQEGVFDRAKYQTQETDGKVIFFRQRMVNGVPIDWVMPVDTTKEPDMLGLLRNYEFVGHDEGNEQSCRPRVPMLFKNGNPTKAPSGGTEYWGVTTWYKVAANPGVTEVDMGYLHAGLAVKSWPGQWHKVGNTWAVDVEFVLNDKGGAPPMSRWFIAADVNYHEVETSGGEDPVDKDPYGGGVLLASGNGPKKGVVNLDLSKLAAGPHRLVLCNIQEDGQREARAFGFFGFTKT